tara:strand:+ start:629 stop:814 length:186 start_codon:yes stop_codon:yes gene_type:complete
MWINLKVGDLVKHREGDIGIITAISPPDEVIGGGRRLEYQVFFLKDGDIDWFYPSWLTPIS